MYALLTDGTRVEGLSASSTASSLLAIREDYGKAGAVRDLFTKENSGTVRLFNDDGSEAGVGTNLKLMDGATLRQSLDCVLCEITFTFKTELEILQDEITELQDAIIGE